MSPEKQFMGFNEQTIIFLEDLRMNNNKLWFESNRQRYQEAIIQSFQSLIAALSPVLLTIDPFIVVNPVVGKTISRINRDTRFSRDKSPYRSNVWVTFKRPIKEWQDSPVFFFEITPDSYRYGMGFYAASKATMDSLREVIDTNPKAFEKAIAFYDQQQTFTLEGDQYKRIIDPEKSPKILEWYQRKNLFLVCTREIDDRLFSSRLFDELAAGFTQLADFYHYLHGVKNGKNQG